LFTPSVRRYHIQTYLKSKACRGRSLCSYSLIIGCDNSKPNFNWLKKFSTW
jgi:hypothetical protein